MIAIFIIVIADATYVNPYRPFNSRPSQIEIILLLIRERLAKLLRHSCESRNPEFAATKTFWIPARAGMTVVRWV